MQNALIKPVHLGIGFTNNTCQKDMLINNIKSVISRITGEIFICKTSTIVDYNKLDELIFY